MKCTIFLLFVLSVAPCLGQYSFEGQLEKNNAGRTVYLSIIDDHRKLSKIYVGQIIRRTETDSLGFFSFKGDNLSPKNQIYRIHTDGCSDLKGTTEHFPGNCDNSYSILFLAKNTDTIYFPETATREIFCSITSNNDRASVFLQIEDLKERMLFDFSDFRSEANRNLNSQKWFGTLQEYGRELNEPLAELYIYDFLSDKRNETFAYYLKDLSTNTYYDELLDRLKTTYPDSRFTQLYEAEIVSDKLLYSFSEKEGGLKLEIFLAGLLVLSLITNIYLIFRQKKLQAKQNGISVSELTKQERKTLDLIMQDRTNKEIAAELFVSVSTVKTHINNLYKKLKVGSREALKASLEGKKM
ncbi:LuxR C-terminal-related transcriptional regulator [Flavobacteriaceae bacterium 3-367]|uniref:response regulator transcription factor n=1 Tax=Eudoraea algarum TaxID=3417568 RepID=UPI00327A826F